MVLSSPSDPLAIGAALVVDAPADICFCTSSFNTRPSFPVPEISSMSMLCSLVKYRTAGVASEACLPDERGLLALGFPPSQSPD